MHRGHVRRSDLGREVAWSSGLSELNCMSGEYVSACIMADRGPSTDPVGKGGSLTYDHAMRSWTRRTTTTAERRKAKEAALERNVRAYGEVMCESCGGRMGEVNIDGKSILVWELDHIRNISQAGDNVQLRRQLETDPDNHQILCGGCHWNKTLSEGREGRERKSGRTKRKHPGLLR